MAKIILGDKEYHIVGKTSGPNMETYYSLAQSKNILFGPWITRTETFMKKFHKKAVWEWENLDY